MKDETFYVALFTDSDRTERLEGFDVQKISIVNGSSGKVIIEGIPSGTYYIGETDADGTLIEEGEMSDGTGFKPVFDSYEVEIPENGTEGVKFSFKNVITDPPKTADIIVNKKLVDQETGKDVLLTGKYTVFVALFSDEDYLVRVSEIKEIVIDGTSSGTATFKDVDEGTYYISETNADGTAIGGGTIGNTTQYEAYYTEGKKITVTGENETEKITFENVFDPSEPPEPEPPTPTPPTPPAPSTGDPSVNYLNTYVVLALISLGVIINVVVRLKKKS